MKKPQPQNEEATSTSNQEEMRATSWVASDQLGATATLEELLNTAYLVRNNLFHGGKVGKYENNSERKKELCNAAVDVIYLALKQAKTHGDAKVHKVHQYFAETINDSPTPSSNPDRQS